MLVADTQSRSDFFPYQGQLFLIHAPVDRNGFGILQVDPDDFTKSKEVLVADMHSSCFYPFTRVYGSEVYLSYTVDRKHIRLSHFNLSHFLS